MAFVLPHCTSFSFAVGQNIGPYVSQLSSRFIAQLNTLNIPAFPSLSWPPEVLTMLLIIVIIENSRPVPIVWLFKSWFICKIATKEHIIEQLTWKLFHTMLSSNEIFSITPFGKEIFKNVIIGDFYLVDLHMCVLPEIFSKEFILFLWQEKVLSF